MKFQKSRCFDIEFRTTAASVVGKKPRVVTDEHIFEETFLNYFFPLFVIGILCGLCARDVHLGESYCAHNACILFWRQSCKNLRNFENAV